jgi:hypothetical protein
MTPPKQQRDDPPRKGDLDAGAARRSGIPCRRAAVQRRPAMRCFPFVLLLPLAAAPGCAQQLIPNTDVADNSENRQVVEFCELYRHAVEERDTSALLSLVSDRYYDDNGTPSADDDMDLDALRGALARWSGELVDVRYEIRYRRVTFRDDRVLVDFTYTGSFKVRSIGDEERWERRLRDNRIEIVREDGEYRILSGL